MVRRKETTRFRRSTDGGDDYQPLSPTTYPRGSTPVPDPTELTDRAIARLRSEMVQYINGQFEVRDTRLAAIDEATRLRLDQATVVSADVQYDISRAVKAAMDVVEERFKGVDQRFVERDTRSEREFRDNKAAVDAAFAAQKEAAAKQDEANAKAIDKSERATAETIKTNQELTRATTDTLTKDVDSLKLAVNAIQAAGVGRTGQRAEATEGRTAIYATIGVVISLIIATIAVVGFIISIGAR